MRGVRIAVATALLPAAATALRAQPPAARTPDAPPCVPIADGARVRTRDPATRTMHVGTALGWHTPAPRLVSTGGDTLPLGPGHRTWASRGNTARRTLQGAIAGWAVGVIAVVGDCGLARTCGEQNPLPLLGTALGAVIGHQLRRERWERATPAQSLACATR